MKVMEQWQTMQIKEIYNGLYDGPHATPKPAEEGPIFLGIKNVTDDGQLDLNTIRHIAEAEFGRWTKRVEPRAGDIVFTYEATLNRYAIIPEGFRGCLGRRMALIRPDPEKIDTRFLHFYFFSKSWRDVISNNILTGATVDRIPLTTFPDFPITIPSLPTQRRIAGILSAYDDLIENNLRRIRILEEMAQSLYREWFAHFRIPSEVLQKAGLPPEITLVDSPLGPIPDGWEVKRVEDALKRFPAGKKYSQKTVDETGSIPVLDQGKSGIIGYHNKEPGFVATEDDPVIVFANHTCYQRIIQYPFSAIQNVLPFRSAPDLERNLYWLHWATKDVIEFNDYKGHWPEFIAKQLLIPPAEICGEFGKRAEATVRETYCLERKNQTLRQTRDLLLPKLLGS
ncbi:restriction endonuclease subunit S [Haloferula sp.]|uniref:restriction endonuclease subunit S n=1 Tax=Haloferula sp. TaxID=2497595 RepID=UPI00329CAF86